MSRKPAPGTVVRIDLPDGSAAFARVLRDAAIGVYPAGTDGPPPPSSRNYEFVVGIYDRDLRELPVVGVGDTDDDLWPPPMAVKPVLPNDPWKIYDRGVLRTATADEAAHLEPASVWSLGHIVNRLMRDSVSRDIREH